MAQNLAAKYRPKTWDDVTEQKIIIDILKNMCKDPEMKCRNFLFIGPAGTGKAQPLYSKVLTTSGYIDMKDVQLGDEVITAKNNVAKVTEIYPQGKRAIYEITLQDRTKIRVADNHLNCVYRYNEDKKKREDYIITTTDLIDLFESSRFKLRMDTPSVDWNHQDVPLDPYLYGALLGDGSLHNNLAFSNPEEDILEHVDTLLRNNHGLRLKKVPGDNVDHAISAVGDVSYRYQFMYEDKIFTGCESLRQYLHSIGYPAFDADTLIRLSEHDAPLVQKHFPELSSKISLVINEEYDNRFNVGSFINILDDLGMRKLSKEKHIDSRYLINSRDIRVALLHGLFDTDGYTSKEGHVEYTTSSKQLSDDFAFLVRSLGIRDTVTEGEASYVNEAGKRIHCGVSYTHHMKAPNGFFVGSSIKHKNRYRTHQNDPIRNIVSIEYVGEEECQCIMLDHEDHTYISDGFIPTHNTTTARIMANVLNNNVGQPIEVDAASNSGVDAVRNIIDQARSYPVGQKWKIFILDEVHSFSSQAWQALLKTLEEGPAKSIFFLCTTNPEKIPATILSRVQTFQLSKISLKGIHDRLIHIIECENAEGRNIVYEDDAVNYIAKMANGGMRDSITLLDKALAYSNELSTKTITQALNLPAYDDYFRLLNAYASKNNKEIAACVDEIYNSGVNFVKWFEGFHSFIMNIVKYILLQDINRTMIPSTYQEKIAKYSTVHLTICLKLANKLVKMNQELKSTQYLQELALTYLCFLPAKEAK